MIASLPMYDIGAAQGANDRLWAGVRAELSDLTPPQQLSRGLEVHASWLRPDLFMSQTCGLPFRTELKGRVRYVGTPDYGVPGCPPGYYRSCIVVRRDDGRGLDALAGARLARNDVRSQSGWAAMVQHLAEHTPPLRPSGSIVETGAHAASAVAVDEGRADFAALDAVTWALLLRETDIGERLHVLDWTRPTPGLPLITALGRDPAPIYTAFATAIATLSKEDRTLLHIRGIVQIPVEDYYREPIPRELPQGHDA
jgi:ABC-type phosphate/phosphonate transport system substrate-binding protein